MNSYDPKAASPSSWCVCQFRHFRAEDNYFTCGFAGVCAGGAGAEVPGAGVAGAVVAGAADDAGGVTGLGAADGGGAGVPLTTDPVPRCPMMDKRQREQHEEHCRDRGGFGQQRRARARAECRLAAAAAERAGDIAPASLLQQNDQRQESDKQNVKTDDQYQT